MIYKILPEIPPLIERFGIKYGVGSGNTQIKQQAFKRAIELLEDSRDIPGLRQKLKLQKALNQTGDAMLTNRTLLDLLPNDVGLNVGLGELLLDSGEVDQAIQIFNEYRFRDTRAKRLHRKLTQDQINR
ncbi:MAG: tetratricopeptide repeat protein [Planctomycetaceae bacterium]|nr:tetratricopeptide repeat protein [Planctomycetaceae bacterium]